MKSDFIKGLAIIFIYFIICAAIFASESLVKNIFLGSVILVYAGSSEYKKRKEKNEILRRMKLSNETYMEYKESNKWNIAFSIIMIINSILLIDGRRMDKNRELMISGEEEINNIVEFIIIANSKELAGIVIFIVLFILFVQQLISRINGTATIGEYSIVFHDGNIVKIDEIKSIDYEYQLIHSKKRSIVRIDMKEYNKKIVVSNEDLDKLKLYFESKGHKNN